MYVKRGRPGRGGVLKIALAAVVFCLTGLMLAAQVPPSPAYAATDAVYSQADTDSLASLINREREEHSLQPLALDGDLCEVARGHAIDMIKAGYFGHVSPDGTSLSTRLSRANIAFRKAGENLAGHRSVALAHDMLMESPTHRGNVLDREFETVGVAVVSGGPYGMIVVEVFVARPEAEPELAALPETT